MPFARSLCKPPGLPRQSLPLALSWNSESLCAGEAELLPPVSFVLLIPALGSPLTSGSCFPPALEDRRGRVWPNALHQAGAMPSSPAPPEPSGSSARIIRLC